MNLKNRILMPLLSVIPLFFVNCGLLDDIVTEEEPTFSRMQGVWEVTEATNEFGDNILDKINFPRTVFKLESNKNVISTAGPMITYLVYGANNYTSVASKIDQVFDYTKLEFDDGRFNTDNGVVSRFSMEIGLKTIPGLSSVGEILSWFGYHVQIFDETIFHKFMDIKVTFESDEKMIWEFDEDVETEYYTLNEDLNKNLISISTDHFSHCTFVLEKQVDDVMDIIKKASN